MRKLFERSRTESLLWILAVSGLFAAVSWAQSVQLPVNLNTGWTLIAWPVKPITLVTAWDLHNQIEQQNNNADLVLSVRETQGSLWETWSASLPTLNNFEIEYGKAYFVQSTAAATWLAQGEPATNVTLTLAAGNNGVGMPLAGLYTASSLAATINAWIAGQGIAGSVTHVREWDGSLWTTYAVGLPFGDFPIVPGKGYLLVCSNLLLNNQPVVVSVTLPNANIQNMLAQISGLPLNAGVKNSLSAKLQAALNSLGDGNTSAACNQFSAFLNQVDALVLAGQLSSATALNLKNQTQAVMAALGC